MGLRNGGHPVAIASDAVNNLEGDDWCHSTVVKVMCIRVDSRFAPNQWETSLQSNVASHWLGANLESTLCASIAMEPGVRVVKSLRSDFSSFPPCLPIPPLQRLLPLTLKPFVPNLTHLGQRIYGSGEMYWMTFLCPWPKVMAGTSINKNLLVCTRTTHPIATKLSIFDVCPHSAAVLTSVICVCDSKDLTDTSAKLGNPVTNMISL